MESNDLKSLILLTGATGYIGGRLLRALESRGYRIRCLARRPEFLQARVSGTTEVVGGDVLDGPSLHKALNGVDTAYYLVHSMGSAGSFEEQDRNGAVNFGQAARACGVRRIVYLGGLGSSGTLLSSHLRSRHEVGELLRASGVPTIELRASIVIGSGSLSFEMVRALVERLPAMVTPRWVANEAQPIAIPDLLEYLVAAMELPIESSMVYEIGGADRVSYGDIMREYARQRGLRRIMIPVPVLTPRLSSLWLGLVTPLFARVGRKLVDSICHPTVVEDQAAARDFAVRPMGLRQAIEVALRDEDREAAAPRWYNALSSAGPVRDWGGVRFGNRLVDSREMQVPVAPDRAFAPLRRIGGRTGWYSADWLWSLRGFLDLLVGGVGMRRGRRDPERLAVGDVLDCWRVEVFEEDRRLRLAAEMRLPGRAWLEFEVEGDEAGSTIRQTASFDPVGLSGLLYWYSVYPLHQAVFAGMLNGIARAALGDSDSADRAEVLEREQWLPRPVEEVFSFFANPYNLESITPEFLHFKVLRASDAEIHQGTTIDYRLRLRGVPITWQSRIEEWQPCGRFVDRQLHGPYALWHHTHEFEPHDGGTIVRDRVRYRLPLGVLGRGLAGAWVRRDLRAIFDYRCERMRQLFPAGMVERCSDSG